METDEYELDACIRRMIAEQALDLNNPDDYEAVQAVARNAYLIRTFADDIAAEESLNEDAVHEHMDNLDLYLNYYALGKFLEAEEALTIDYLDPFMQEWFPWNVESCSVYAIRSMADSIHRFASWMNQNIMISDEENKQLAQDIAEHRQDWEELFSDHLAMRTSKMN